MVNTLVTGGSGFIGRRLVRELLLNDYNVCVLTRNDKYVDEYVSGESRLNYCYGDVRDKSAILSAFKNVDIVYHLAAAMSGDWETHKETTIGGTENVIESCAKNKVKHLIYVSTLNVYDTSLYEDGVTVSEQFPYERKSQQRGFYSAAKLKAEKLVIEKCNDANIKLTIFRPGLVYGERAQLLSKDIAIRIYKSIYALLGNGSRKLPLVHVDNLVNALVLAANMQQGNFELFNVVDKQSPTQTQYLKMYNSLAGSRIHVVKIPMFLVKLLFRGIDLFLSLKKGNGAYYYYRLNALIRSPYFASDNLREKLGWVEKTNLEDSLTDLLSRSNGEH